MEELPLTRSLDLVGHSGKLAARNLWIVIGDQDERVNTQRAMELALAVSHASVSQRTGTRLQFHLEAADGHRVPEGAYSRAAQWLLRQAPQNEEEQLNER